MEDLCNNSEVGGDVVPVRRSGIHGRDIRTPRARGGDALMEAREMRVDGSPIRDI